MLDLLDGVEVSEWSYIRDPETRHIGPIAEDFWRAFGLGKGATLISPLDVRWYLAGIDQNSQPEN